MIRPHDCIQNPLTGQIMIFRKTSHETNGQLLEIECFNPRTDMREPAHIHPKQESTNEIISGQLHFWVDGKTVILRPGERIVIPAGTPHYFWNEDAVTAHHLATFTPALTIDGFFETYFALANDEKLNAQGRPNFLHACLVLLKHRNDIRVISPPWPLQIVSYVVLAPLALLFGFRSSYLSKKQVAF